MPNSFNPASLRTLEIDPVTLNLIPEKDQLNYVRRQWRAMCLRTHPDKPGGSNEKFQAVNDAYNKLTTSTSTEIYIHDIFIHIPVKPLNIPLTGFDLLMEEGIIKAFEELGSEYNLLPENARLNFALQNAAFLNLVRELEKNKERLTTARSNYFYEQHKISLVKYIILEWRRFIIALFGEEFLDDFQYRQALSTGELREILATRKLLSPVKWLVALINSLSLLICATESYYSYQGDHLRAMFISILSISLDGVRYLLNIAASPINNIVRPLAAYTGLENSTVILGFLAMGIALTAGLTSGLVILPSTTLILQALNVLINMVSGYQDLLLLKNLEHSGNPNPGLVILLGLIILLYVIPTAFPVYDLLSSLGLYLFIFQLNKRFYSSPIETLPLPQEPVPAEIQSATLQGYKTANQSHLFFGTLKNEEYQNNRTTWQKSCSFFGIDRKETIARATEERKAPYPQENVLALMAL